MTKPAQSSGRRPWFEETFGETYLKLYAHRTEEEACRAVCALVPKPEGGAGALLDLCCGAGRHLGPLRDRGWTPVGLDLSAVLLGEASRRKRRAPLVRASMDALPFADGSFDACVNFFTAFGYFAEDERNFGVFAEVARVLRPGGVFLFDFLNGARVREALRHGDGTEERRTAADGTVVAVRRWLSGDRLRAEKETRWAVGSDGERIFGESVRLFTPEELRPALERAGFTIEVAFGGYDGAPFKEATSDRWIARSRRTQEPPVR